VEAASTTEDSAGALASAALSKYQAQLAGAQQATTTTTATNNSNNNNAGNTVGASAGAGTSAAPASTPKQQDWRHLLKEKSNKLSADDRFRVQQFFVDRFNPTPAAPTYKMKLHEERPKTPRRVNRERDLSRVDYRTFTSKQSKRSNATRLNGCGRVLSLIACATSDRSSAQYDGRQFQSMDIIGNN
jgi:hypothetical protein